MPVATPAQTPVSTAMTQPQIWPQQQQKLHHPGESISLLLPLSTRFTILFWQSAILNYSIELDYIVKANKK
jgi:hypothetical protein